MTPVTFRAKNCVEMPVRNYMWERTGLYNGNTSGLPSEDQYWEPSSLLAFTRTVALPVLWCPACDLAAVAQEADGDTWCLAIAGAAQTKTSGLHQQACKAPATPGTSLLPQLGLDQCLPLLIFLAKCQDGIEQCVVIDTRACYFPENAAVSWILSQPFSGAILQ